ncbi:unnamed protein product, partial [Rangifer tarandus platyrhynchus]
PTDSRLKRRSGYEAHGGSRPREADGELDLGYGEDLPGESTELCVVKVMKKPSPRDKLCHLSNPCSQHELEQVPLSQPLPQTKDVSSVASARNVRISRFKKFSIILHSFISPVSRGLIQGFIQGSFALKD